MAIGNAAFSTKHWKASGPARTSSSFLSMRFFPSVPVARIFSAPAI
jgi:hypothetical protein